MKNKKTALILLGLALALACLLAACSDREPEDRTFNLEVQDGTLVKGNPPLQVKQGDGVTILVDTNKPILFHLHGYDIEQEAVPGNPAKLVFLKLPGYRNDQRCPSCSLPKRMFAPVLLFTQVPTVIAPENNDGVVSMFTVLKCQ